jgi:hypothetical protein
MKATVRSMHSPDVDLENFLPEDPEDVGALIQLLVGPADGPGEESFDVMVCTPNWLKSWTRSHGPTMGRHHLIVERYDFQEIRHYLTSAIEAEHGDTWQELALRISRIGKWEFEDYQP